MIDRTSRDKLATALRQYVSGRITNDDLANIDIDWRDRGAIAVAGRAWCLYDDNYQHRAAGQHYLPKPAREEISRWIMFLHSEIEYTWPEFSFYQVINWPMNLLTSGWWEKRKEKRFQEFMEAGDFSVWPFATRADYDAALEHPRYLSVRHAKPRVRM